MTDSFAGSQSAGNTPSQGSTAPAGHQQQGQGQHSQHAGSSGGDANAMLAAMRAEMDEMKKAHGRTSQEAQHARSIVDKIKNAISPEDEGEKGDEPPAWFDDVLGEILEAERQGVKLPISSKLAVQLHQSQQQLAQALDAIKKLQGQADKLSDPETTINNRAYDAMDQLVGDTLGNVFGGDYPPTVARAVTGSIIGFLKEVQKEAPDKWQEIRRSKAYQQKIVQHFVNEHIPAHLRQLHTRVQESQQPFTYEDAQEALREAMALKPEERAKVMPIVRRALWEQMALNTGGGRRNRR